MPNGEPQPSPAAQFRTHRHDVLNELQLIRAYLQMERPAQAVAVVDRLSTWLQSLTTWQISAGAFGEQLMWTAAVCPHVLLDSFTCQIPPVDDVVEQFCRWLKMWNDELSIRGQRGRLCVTVDQSGFRIMCSDEEVVKRIDEWTGAYPDLDFVVNRW
ncbi:sensor kinase SpoOB-type protein [Alicyclobacillus sacchari]|uniref:Sensor kinase SpoOB-type protein n=1 Tax=Alicyclobacillus sacchari TaxID=392010 RepID=A0A4R8LLG8_9BACL|nr:Spo0B domain-containing protein [Alicyclobacillus sacchari]TDY43370.1 sensor kinase SpoOB-type protein [Alicyclobacillus sacchari]